MEDRDLVGSDGFCTITLLDQETAASLASALRAVCLPDGRGFHVANVHGDAHEHERVQQVLAPVLAAALHESLAGWRPFLSTAIWKPAAVGDPVSFHQDLTYTDERSHRAIVAWVPLVDVDADRGALRVVPGSHRWTDGIRPWGPELPTDGHQEGFARRSETVELVAGEALLYDPALVHGSWPNVSGTDRPVAAVALHREGTQLVHFRVGPDRQVEGYAVDDRFFSEQRFGEVPTGARPCSPWADVVRPSDHERALVAEACS